MTTFWGLVDVDFAERLGWTILHSTWQIAAVAAVYAIAARLLARGTANLRYLLGCAAMLAMVALPVATFAMLSAPQQNTAARTVEFANFTPGAIERENVVARKANQLDAMPAPAAGAVAPAATTATYSPRWSAWSKAALPWVSAGWLVGVALFSLRLLAGLNTVEMLRRRGLSPLSQSVARLAERLVAELHIRQSVRFAQSALVEVPTVLGYLRPVVLLPASALSGLTAAELEMILAHELAHVRRHDYLVNLLQTGIEAILFHHPAMWWVSAQVRQEREHCCDDLAVQHCGNRAAYVRALLALELKREATTLVLAASGGSLVDRIRRLIAPHDVAVSSARGGAWLAGLLPIGIVAICLLLSPALAESRAALEQAADPNTPTTATQQPQADTSAAEQPKVEDTAEQSKPEAPATQAPPPVAPAPKDPPAEKPPAELVLNVTLEDNAQTPIEFVLTDNYARPVKTWDKVAPGDVRLPLPKLEHGHYDLKVYAAGHGDGRLGVDLTPTGPQTRVNAITLGRKRYVVLRYAVNLQGARTFVGPYVKEGRVAISFGHVPDLFGDWMIRQAGDKMTFFFHRYGANGFAPPEQFAKFDDIQVAPQPDQYVPQTTEVVKGAIHLNRIEGNRKSDRRYAKILVEDITETPPPGVPVIDTLLPPARNTAPPLAKSLEGESDRSSGDVVATVHLAGDAREPVTVELRDRLRNSLKTWPDQQPGELKLKLPELEHDRYWLVVRAKGYAPARVQFAVGIAGVTQPDKPLELYRARYLVVRWAVNTKGQRELTGPDVQTGRSAVMFGQIPGLVDWSVDQQDGDMVVDYHRALNDSGFASAAADKTFDELELAPAPEDYASTPLVFTKGMILFNRVLGHRPEFARYAKLEIEDVTETPPKGLEIINAPRRR